MVRFFCLTYLNNRLQYLTILLFLFKGKEFVVGYEDGVVYKVDITYHDPRTSKCWPPDPSENSEMPNSVTALVWINYEYRKKPLDIVSFSNSKFLHKF